MSSFTWLSPLVTCDLCVMVFIVTEDLLSVQLPGARDQLVKLQLWQDELGKLIRLWLPNAPCACRSFVASLLVYPVKRLLVKFAYQLIIIF